MKKELLSFGFFFLFLFWGLKTILAAEIIVNSTEQEYPIQQDGDCSFSEAIIAANTDAAVDACTAGSGEDTIRLGENATYTLTRTYGDGSEEGLPTINFPLIIEGSGATIERSADAPSFRLLYSTADTVTLRSLKFRGGSAKGITNQNGGAIYHFKNLVVDNCTFTENTANKGGAIYSRNGQTLDGQPTLASLSITGSTFSGNSATIHGGGLYIEGNSVIQRTEFVENSAGNWGGAIVHRNGLNSTSISPVQPATLELNDVKFSQNRSSFGAAVYNMGRPFNYTSTSRYPSGTLIVFNGSFSGNTSHGIIFNAGYARIFNSSVFGNMGTGVRNDSAGYESAASLMLANSTVADNHTEFYGGGIFSGLQDSANIFNTTIFKNTATQEGNGIFATSSRVYLQNTILAGNGNPECAGRQPINSRGNNLFGIIGNCAIQQGAGDILNENPKLAPLAGTDDSVNGNEYLPVKGGSPAINAGNSAICIDSLKYPKMDKDQLERVRNTPCDIGAIEFDPNDPNISLALHWSFDEEEGVRVIDESGSGRDGILTGGALREVGGPKGKALLLDGIDDCARTESEILTGLENSWTLSLWTYRTNPAVERSEYFVLIASEINRFTNPRNRIEVLTDYPYPGVMVRLWGDEGIPNNALQFRTRRPVDGGGVLEQERWQHIAVTKSADQYAIYVNGVSQPDLDFFSEYQERNVIQTDMNRSIRVGCQFNLSHNIQGKGDEFVTFNRALAEEEIMALCRSNDPTGESCGR